MIKNKCIYCLAEKETHEFSKTEHVIPQSFGMFDNNFTLNGVVCDECNQYFGNILELELGRDSLEGISRYTQNLKKHSEYSSLGKRSKMKVIIAEGEFKGAQAYLEYSLGQNEILLNPLPQVGLYDVISKSYKYNDINIIDDIIKGNTENIDLKSIVCLGCNDTQAKGISQKFGIENMISKTPIWRNSQAELLASVTFEISDIILRSISKIAFNYLTYWIIKHSLTDKDYLLCFQFDVIRRFIRHGQRPNYEILIVDNTPILEDEKYTTSHRLGHIVTVSHFEKKGIMIGEVSIFNMLRYKILLGNGLFGEERKIMKGNFFVPYTHEIVEIESYRKC